MSNTSFTVKGTRSAPDPYIYVCVREGARGKCEERFQVVVLWLYVMEHAGQRINSCTLVVKDVLTPRADKHIRLGLQTSVNLTFGRLIYVAYAAV